MRKMRIGINGFGRIGRVAARIALTRMNVELVAINSRSPVSSHAYLLAHDSTHGTFSQAVNVTENELLVNNKKIRCFQNDDPAQIPWNEADVDIVIEASGKFTQRKDALKHVRDSVKHVIVSAPSPDADATIVMGVNETIFDSTKHQVISNASCTTNCTAVVAKVLDTAFGIDWAMMTTVHAATQSQSILDASNRKDKRGGRSVLNNIIPATTGASRAVEHVLPQLKGKLSALSLRVPVNDGSIIDFVAQLKKPATAESVNNEFKQVSQGNLKGILSVATDELVSSDIIGTPYSATVDPYLTSTLGENIVKVFAWYDNEWGYATRLIDLVEYIVKKL